MTILEKGVVTLTSGHARCAIAPHAGGAVAGFWWEVGGRRLDWLRPASPVAIARHDAANMGCFPMVPYGGRIREGRFHFCGREVIESVAGPDQRHAIHGHGWRGDWTVAERDDARLVLEFTYDAAGWHWPYRARQIFELGPDMLELTLEVENLSEGLMPTGLGFHPFFPRTPRATLAAKTQGVWLTDAEIMPIEETQVPPAWDLAEGRPVHDLRLDNVFTGWEGPAVLSWPERAARLTVSATQPLFSFLVVYVPRDGDFLCVEPSSHCTDAVNLAREGVPNTGLRVLAPSARRSGTMRLRPEFL